MQTKTDESTCTYLATVVSHCVTPQFGEGVFAVITKIYGIGSLLVKYKYIGVVNALTNIIETDVLDNVVVLHIF